MFSRPGLLLAPPLAGTRAVLGALAAGVGVARLAGACGVAGLAGACGVVGVAAWGAVPAGSQIGAGKFCSSRSTVPPAVFTSSVVWWKCASGIREPFWNQPVEAHACQKYAALWLAFRWCRSPAPP